MSDASVGLSWSWQYSKFRCLGQEEMSIINMKLFDTEICITMTTVGKEFWERASKIVDA